MCGATPPETWIRPVGHDFGIDCHLIIEPEERNGGEFFEEMVADLLGNTLPLTEVDALRQGLIALFDELVMKSTPHTVTGMGADPFFRGPPANDIGPNAAVRVLASSHVSYLRR